MCCLISTVSFTFPRIYGLNADGGLQFVTSRLKFHLFVEAFFDSQQEEVNTPQTPYHFANDDHS